MNAKAFHEAIEYERLTQAIYQTILHNEGENIAVEHNVEKAGRSGVEHQVDVYWRFRQAGLDHTVLIECKNYASPLTLEKVRNFFVVLHDVGNCRGVMVTKTGYQAGVQDFARYYGISLKILRQPNEEDWKGRVKDVRIRIAARSVVSTEEQPIVITLYFKPADKPQETRLQRLINEGRGATSGPGMMLLDRDGNPKTEEMRYWLPRNLDVLSKLDGGPQEQKLSLEDSFLYFAEGSPDQELVQVDALVVTYYVETTDTNTVELHGEQIVEAVLKDQFSGKVEHIKRRENTVD